MGTELAVGPAVAVTRPEHEGIWWSNRHRKSSAEDNLICYEGFS